MIHCGVRRGRARLPLAGVIVGAVVAFWLVACPPALAQLSFSSSNQGTIKGLMPVAVVASDFNGDSGIDVATANQGLVTFGEGTDVLLGNGSGGFFADNEFQGDRGADSVAVGDFNGDGHTDLVLANCCSGDVSVLLGAGDGSFAAPANYTRRERVLPRIRWWWASSTPTRPRTSRWRTATAAVHPSRSCWATATGPSAPPKASGPTSTFFPASSRQATSTTTGTSTWSSPTRPRMDWERSVLLGHGDGTFSSAPEVNNAGDTPQAVAVGDFNGDTIPDLAFGDDPSGPNGEISIVLGKGNGTFDQQQFIQYPVGSSTTAVAVSDFNDDSVVDVATTDNFGAVWVLPGEGNGTFLTR